MPHIYYRAELIESNCYGSEFGAVKGAVTMTNWKAVFGIMAFLACTAVILWSIDTYIRPGYQCGTDSLRVAMRTHEELVKYLPMIMRLPHNPDPEPEFLRDENGDLTNTWGIVILTDEELDRAILPSGDRIPGSLKGVPLQVLPREIGIRERPWHSEYEPEFGTPHRELQEDVLRKNLDFFLRYPFYIGDAWFVADTGKDPSNVYSLDWTYGIEVFVTEKVDPSTLPLEDRIPECLEDVPVRIKVWPE